MLFIYNYLRYISHPERSWGRYLRPTDSKDLRLFLLLFGSTILGRISDVLYHAGGRRHRSDEDRVLLLFCNRPVLLRQNSADHLDARYREQASGIGGAL